VLGLEADLSQALANVLGYRFRIVDVPSDRIIPGLVSGEYDLGMSFVDTPAQEKLVDFVTYLAPGTSFYVNAAAAVAIRKPADLCGRSVAVVRGTAQAMAATTQSARCKAAGKRTMRIAIFRDAEAARLALSSGRVQVGMADSAVVAYAMRQMHGQFKLAGPASDGELRSIAVAKENDMAAQVRDALETVMGDGTYAAILARWGAQAGAIAAPRINVAAD
jgi:polar amino acid transport system substrate-binding protein